VLDVRVGMPPLWALGPYAAGLWLWAAGRQGLRAATLVGVGTLGLLLGRGPAAADGRLHLTALDVGQGDCLVVRSPHGRVLVVDAGGSTSRTFDVGEAVVAPYLWWLGVRRLEGVLVTHAHPDHAGGVPFLLHAFDVGEAWEGIAPRRDAGYVALDDALRAAPVTRRAVVRGAGLTWDGVRLDVLSPTPRRPAWKTRNDDSVVLALGFGSRRFLLTGDLEAAGEAQLPLGAVDVVKVPHHGSRTSSTAAFIAATSPRIAIVSAGNRYGHPHSDVLARYREAGALLLRTDRDGAVDVATDGEALWLRTQREGRWRRIAEGP
jgi:competence protein ComEC